MTNSKNAVIVSAQFLVELPENISSVQAEDWGCDWLSSLGTNALDYRHPKIAGIHIRPVSVKIKDIEAEDLFNDNNLIQL